MKCATQLQDESRYKKFGNNVISRWCFMCFPDLLEKPDSLPGDFPHMVSQVVSVLRQLLRNGAGAQGPEAQSGEATTATFFGAQRTKMMC